MITVVITQVTGPTGLPLPQVGNNDFRSMLPYQVRHHVRCRSIPVLAQLTDCNNKNSHESEWRYRQSIDVDCELATSDPDQFMLYPTVNYKHSLKCNLSFPTQIFDITVLYYLQTDEKYKL